MSANANRFGKNANKPELDALAGLRWDDLACVLALLRAGTLSGAATRLAVEVSTVARRLEGLEQRMGVHLFDRTRTGVQPTELAEALAPVAEAMERAAADAMVVLAGREQEPEGTVRLSAPPGIASWILAPAAVRLRKRHPKLVLELDASTAYVDLTRREADLALRVRRPTSGDLVATRLVEAAPIVAAAPRLVRRLGALASLDDIDWITWGPELAHLPDGQWVTKHVDPSRVALRTNAMDAQMHGARAGLGAVLVHQPFVRFVGLEVLPLGKALAARVPPLPEMELWLVGHRALREVPRVRAVWDFLLELFEAAKPGDRGA